MASSDDVVCVEELEEMDGSIRALRVTLQELEMTVKEGKNCLKLRLKSTERSLEDEDGQRRVGSLTNEGFDLVLLSS